VCERVIVIHGGRVVVDQPVRSLRSGYIRKKRLVVETVERELALSIDGVSVLGSAPHRCELEVDLRRVALEAVIEAVLRAARIRDLTVADPPMDEIVQAIYDAAPASWAAAERAEAPS